LEYFDFFNKVHLMKYLYLIAFSFFFGCGIYEDKEIYLPEVRIDNISASSDSIYTDVTVIANGAKLEALGLAFERSIAKLNEKVGLDVKENMLVYGIDSEGEYRVAIPVPDPEITYYFKAFVTEEYLYAESMIDSFLTPRPEAPIVPCVVNANVLTYKGVNYSLIDTDWSPNIRPNEIRAVFASSNGNITINFEFNQLPFSGNYTTSNLIDNETRFVEFSITTNSEWFIAFEGIDVYVNNIDDSSIEITICEEIIGSSLGESIIASFNLSTD